MTPTTEALEARVRRARSRAAVRAWEYRQRHHAKGVWVRLRRLLADARACWVVDRAEVERLERQGHVGEEVGHLLEPPRKLFVLSAAEAARVHGRPIRVELSEELLTAEGVVLVRFGDDETP